MIDCEHSAGDYKSSKISFGVVMESSKLFKSFLLTSKLKRYLIVQLKNYYKFKTKKMCNKAILENGGMLGSVPN